MKPEASRASIIVSSDRAAAGTYEDKAGPAARERLEAMGFVVSAIAVVPDERERIIATLDQVVPLHDLIVVSGGTGISPRDITPQTLEDYCDYDVPGLGEYLRRESFQFSANAFLSRCGAWVSGNTLILAVPGNPKAVVEQLDILKDMLPHALNAVKGTCQHRSRKDVPVHHD